MPIKAQRAAPRYRGTDVEGERRVAMAGVFMTKRAAVAGGRVAAAAGLAVALAGGAPAPALHWTPQAAAALVEIIEGAAAQGLDPAAYAPAAIERAAVAGDPARLDAVATAAALALAGDYAAGRVPPGERVGWHIAGPARSEPALRATIAGGLQAGRLAASFEALLPVHEDYRQLRAALAQTPAEERARRDQLRANLERWRWMPRDLGARYVLVNVPAYSLKLVADGRVIEERAVIVGKPSTPTPQFSTQIAGVILNPWWEVPRSIVAESVGSLVLRHPARAAAQGYVVQRNPDGSVRYRQKPGPQNALGQMKLFMPNPFSVYLHDTPARGKFEETERAFSHGCIRVKGAVDFAALLLADDPTWTRAQIDRVLASGESTKVRLSRTIPVHVGYFTVATRDGGLVYHGDPYRRDAGVLSRLDRRAPVAIAARAADQCPA
jgi:murein L,D-transpeptidase YcbB/YkuD